MVHSSGTALIERGQTLDLAHGDSALAQERINVKAVVELLDSGHNRHHFVNRIVPELVGSGVNRAPLGDHFQFHPPLVAAVHIHLGWLADDDIVRAEALALDQRLAGQPVAILLHIAEVIHREAVQQAEFPGQGDAVEHAGC